MSFSCPEYLTCLEGEGIWDLDSDVKINERDRVLVNKVVFILAFLVDGNENL